MEPGPDRCAVQRPLKRSVTPSLSASTPVIDVVIERRVVAGVETVDHVCIDAKRLQRIARVEHIATLYQPVPLFEVFAAR